MPRTLAASLPLLLLCAPSLGQDASPPLPPSPTPATPPLARFAGPSGANRLLNGDFELTSAQGCTYNLTNNVFDLVMSDIVAIGDAEEIDVMADGAGCFGPPPASGAIKIGLHRQAPSGPVDAIALLTTETIPAGTSCSVDLEAACVDDFDPCPGQLQFGFLDPSGAETIVFTSAPIGAPWTTISFDFVPQAAVDALTIRVDEGSEAWIHLDAVSLRTEIGVRYCTSVPNSTGAAASLTLSGSDLAGPGSQLTLAAAPVPNLPGLFLHGANQATLPLGNGVLCTSIDIVRLGAPVLPQGNTVSLSIDNAAFMTGVTRHFQYWYRDSVGAGSNFTDAMAVTFR